MQPPAGYTPLHMAVGYSRTATVQVLLDFGADPEVGDKDGKNVMDLVEKLRGPCQYHLNF